jgi:uncharacterized protein (TIGR02266 family)
MRTLQEDFQEFIHLDRKREADGLTTIEFERWQILHHRLDAAFGGRRPPGAAEQRQSLRLPTRLRVTYDGLRDEGGVVVNLSRGGCFVRTRLPAPVGTRLNLIIDATNAGEEIEVEGEVVSTCLRNVGRGPGMGIRFEDMSPEDAKRLEDLYGNILSFFAFSS